MLRKLYIPGGEMAAGSPAGQMETGQDVIFTLESGYRRPYLRRGVTMLILGAICGYITTMTSSVLLFSGAVFSAIWGLEGLYYLGTYFWSTRFRTRLCPEGIEVRGYFNHFVRWTDVTGIRSKGFELAGRRPPSPPYLTRSGTIDPGYSSVRAGTGYRRRRTSSMGGVRGKLYTIRISRRRGRRLMLRAPLVTAWQSDPEFDNKLLLIQQWWQTYGQAAAAAQASSKAMGAS
jgi:hypothetical protein